MYFPAGAKPTVAEAIQMLHDDAGQWMTDVEAAMEAVNEEPDGDDG